MTAESLQGPESFAGESFGAVSRRTALTDRIKLADRLKQTDSLLALASCVLLPLGLVVILLGWYGAAHTPYLFEQVPYLISGGLIGLGLVLFGGLCYFGSWIARGAEMQRQGTAEVVALLRDIRAELESRPVAPPVVRSRKPADASVETNGNGASYVATRSGSMLHRPDCTVVAGREDLHRVNEASGLKPCGLCNPLSSRPDAVHR